MKWREQRVAILETEATFEHCGEVYLMLRMLLQKWRAELGAVIEYMNDNYAHREGYREQARARREEYADLVDKRLTKEERERAVVDKICYYCEVHQSVHSERGSSCSPRL